MAKGRPLQYNPDEALEAAMLVFWEKGYEATSLIDLLKATRLSKSSLYQGFGSKHGLFLKCLERFQRQTVSDLSRRLKQASTGRSFIENVLSRVINEAREEGSPRGCMLVNTATEFSQLDRHVASRISLAFDSYKSVFLEGVHAGQKDGSIRKDQSAEYLAGYLVMGMSGLRTMVKAGTPPEALESMAAMLIETVS